MKRENRNVGRVGEEVAVDLLIKKGFELILRNFSTRFGEIDIIMKDKGVLVFVEVKTKKGEKFGRPEEMFTRGKYERVKRMAIAYLKGVEVSCRIDMVAVELDENNQPKSTRHYPGVTH